MTRHTFSSGTKAAVFASVAAALVVAAAPAHAQDVDCADLPNPAYGIGGSAQKPIVASYATLFSGLSTPRTIIYQSPGACFAMSALVEGAPITGTATYWAADGEELLCNLPLTGIAADYGIMGNNPETCAGITGLPANVRQFEGDVIGWNLIVPNASSQQSISSEALYFIYGVGADAGVAPWTVQSEILGRTATSAAGIAIASAAGLTIDQFTAQDVRSNGAMVTLLGQSTNPEAAIGFVSSEVADLNRATVRTLAYQHRDQICGYWPDSSATAFDKTGIRFGRYWLWTSSFFYANVDGAGTITNETARQFIGYVTGGIAPTEEVPALDIAIENGNVPQCAMHVRREGDYTALIPFAHPEPCDCRFEFLATGETTCGACTSNADCGTDAPVCRLGFCEVR